MLMHTMASDDNIHFLHFVIYFITFCEIVYFWLTVQEMMLIAGLLRRSAVGNPLLIVLATPLFGLFARFKSRSCRSYSSKSKLKKQNDLPVGPTEYC